MITAYPPSAVVFGMRRTAAGLCALIAALACACAGDADDRRYRLIQNPGRGPSLGGALGMPVVTVTDGYLLPQDSEHRIAYRVIESGLPGPVVMIVAGMHGTEPAGVLAADDARGLVPLRGRIIVVPRANAWCVARGRRLLPPDDPHFVADPAAGDDDDGNLDRCFPEPGEGADGTFAHGALARALWQLAVDHEVGWLLNCHESREYRHFDDARDGQTVIHHEDPRDAQYLADRLNEDQRRLDGIDDTREEWRHHAFRITGPPVSGSFTRAVAQVWDERAAADKRAFTIETARDSAVAPAPPLDGRVRLQKRAMKWLLVRAGSIEEHPRVLLHTPPRTYDGAIDVTWEGAGGPGPFEYIVEANAAADEPWFTVYTGPATAFRFTAGVHGRTYRFRAAARSSDCAAFGAAYGPWAFNEPSRVETPLDADATLRADLPDGNEGDRPELRIDADPAAKSYLRFTVRDVVFPVAAVRLWLYYREGSAESGGTVRLVGDASWREKAITYANRPLHGIARHGSLGPVPDGTWQCFDITGLVTATGVYSLALVTPAADGCSVASRESGSRAPYIEIMK